MIKPDMQAPARFVETVGKSQQKRAPRRRPRWLVLFNCQGFGLSNCLELLCPELVVTTVNVLRAQEELEAISSKLRGYDKVIVGSSMLTEPTELCRSVSAAVSDLPNFVRCPEIWFSGYHPDSCLLALEGPLAENTQIGWHSAIVYAAYRAGLDRHAAAELFCESVYRELGYLDCWAVARDEIFKEFDEHGLDIREEFVQWSRRGPFMHTANHPKIGVLMGLARVLLRKFGLPITECGIVPHDNLVNGAVFPVYPEIASVLGVQGSLLFKRGGRYRLIELEPYIERSFEIYKNAEGVEPSFEYYSDVVSNVRSRLRAVI